MGVRLRSSVVERERVAVSASSRIDELRQRRFAAKMKPPAIFTAAMVEGMSTQAIADLLNECWYDLVRTERRLILDPRYDQFRREARR